jgi:hypothetical protein
MAGADALESVAQPPALRRVEPRRGGPEVALVLVAMREMSGSEAALWTTQHVVQIATIEHELFTVVDERALEREAELLEHTLGARIVGHRESDQLVQAQCLGRVTHDGGAHLGRITLSPEIRANDVAELDLVELLESPAVEPTAADEGATLISEHPDAESMLPPMSQLSVEELARLLLAVGSCVERGNDELVTMELA